MLNGNKTKKWKTKFKNFPKLSTRDPSTCFSSNHSILLLPKHIVGYPLYYHIVVVANALYYYSLTIIKQIVSTPLPRCYCTSTPHIVLLLMLHIKSKIRMLLGSYYFIFLLFLGLLKSSYFLPIFLGDLLLCRILFEKWYIIIYFVRLKIHFLIFEKLLDSNIE